MLRYRAIGRRARRRCRPCRAASSFRAVHMPCFAASPGARCGALWIANRRDYAMRQGGLAFMVALRLAVHAACDRGPRQRRSALPRALRVDGVSEVQHALGRQVHRGRAVGPGHIQRVAPGRRIPAAAHLVRGRRREAEPTVGDVDAPHGFALSAPDRGPTAASSVAMSSIARTRVPT